MITVVGPGAVGGLVAALLERAGREVVVVAREHTAARLRREGLTVRSASLGTWTSRPRVETTVPPGSEVVLAVKAYGLDDVLPLLAAARPREVLTLLNGLDHVAPLRALPGNVTGGSVSVEAQRTTSAIEHRSPGVVIAVPETAAHWATALDGVGLTLRVGGSEQEVLWTKLRMLAVVALLTSYWGSALGEARERDPEMTDGLVGEVAALATSHGLPTEASKLRAVLDGMPGTLRSSLQHDLAAGGPTELEAIGGVLLDRAAAHEMAVPVLETVVGELRQRVTSTSR